MLHGRYHALALDAGNGRPVQRPGEQRVFTQVFEVAPVARIARKIHTPGEHYVETLGARLGADGRSAQIREIRIEGGCDGQSRRQRRGDVVRTQLQGLTTPRLASVSMRSGMPSRATPWT